MEFAIGMPVLILLMTAVIDFGVNVANKVQATHASREGARAASVNRVGDDSGCSLNLATAVSTDARRIMCFTKARTKMDPNLVAVKFFYMGRNGKLTTDFSSTMMAANPYSIVVCVAARQYSLTGLLGGLFSGDFHHSRTVVKTGKSATGTFAAAAEERPLSDGGVTDSWSWCTADDPVGTE